jgi:hypothetical protein
LGAKSLGEVVLQIGRDTIVVEKRIIDIEQENDFRR